MDEEEVVEEGFKMDDELVEPLEGAPGWQFEEESDDASFDKDH